MSSNQVHATEEIVDNENENQTWSQRRIRHITSIQVRNLTPFPVRDAFTSALSQPAEHPQFTIQGHLSDDLDLALGRKRSRRISVHSLNTIRSRKSEEGVVTIESQALNVGSPEHRGRVRAESRVSFMSVQNGDTDTSLVRGLSSPGSVPSIRPPNRPRTISMASSSSSHPNFAGSSNTIITSSAAASSLSMMLPDNSQKSLEKVISSRLVETFVAISGLPSTDDGDGSSEIQIEPTVLSSSSSRPSTPTQGTIPPRERRVASPTKPPTPKGSTATPSRFTKTLKNTSLVDSVNGNRNTCAASPKPSTFVRSSSSQPIRANGKGNTPSPSPSIQKSPSSTSRSGIKRVRNSSVVPSYRLPIYLSPIHRPSTNPYFTVDIQDGDTSERRADTSKDIARIEVWGRVGEAWLEDRSKGFNEKGKEKALGISSGWKKLEDWNVDLKDLVPLPKHLALHPSALPSNTLLITLAPHGQTFYLPPPSPKSRSGSPSPSPSAGYDSDPETGARRVRKLGDLVLPASMRKITSTGDPPPRKRVGNLRKGQSPRSSQEISKTAGWQDLLKLVTLQTCIVDTKESLSEIVHEIDKTLDNDQLSLLIREVLERQTFAEYLAAEHKNSLENSNALRSRINARKESIRNRRETLMLAKQLLSEDIASQVGTDEDIENNRNTLLELRRSLPPCRTKLITTLSAIYPIDVLSPPDLLFTILSVPLPIPLSSSDPAPPLALPDHKEVTEDAVATALGYAAQVVHFLAAYLGKSLVYPVTCVGSRSLIRDGISAMVGPRMFPLFSKGVDTYRFEYGVFLLNKDIEMLMADRDLKALDMRHTLPNLKNLLLTLTDGESESFGKAKWPHSPLLQADHLESPRAKFPPTLEILSSSPQQPSEDNGTALTPPSSGTTTPTATTVDRKSRSLLGLYPLAGFFSRSSSIVSRPSVSSVTETPEGSLVNEDLECASDETMDDEDEDRRTIRGVATDADSDQGAKVLTNEHGAAKSLVPAKEKTLSLKDGSVDSVVTSHFEHV